MGGGTSKKEVPHSEPISVNFQQLKNEFETAKQQGVSNQAIFEKHAPASPRCNGHGNPAHRLSDNLSPKNNTKELIKKNSDGGFLEKGSVDFHERGHERRQQIFSKGIDVMNRGTSSEGGEMKDQHRELLRGYLVNALRTFFFMDDNVSDRVEVTLEKLHCEHLMTEDFLMRQGEDGDKMYIIQSGSLEVLIDNKLVRIISEGDSVGELALLYNAPRSASVRATSPCTLWSLKRETFREVQALASNTTLVQRVAWLQSLPVLKHMDAMDVCKLAGSFKTLVLRDGEVLLTEGASTDRCYLIESGMVSVTSKEDASRESLDAKAGGVQCTSRGNVVVGKSPKKQKEEANKPRNERERTLSNGVQHHREPPTPIHSPKSAKQFSYDESGLFYNEGTFLGTSVMLAAAALYGPISELSDSKSQPWALEEPDGGRQSSHNQRSAGQIGAIFWGAISPVTVRTRGDTRCSYFTIPNFEAMLGSIRQIVTDPENPSKKMTTDFPVDGVGEPMRFTASNFEDVRFLGTGSFGRVTQVVFKKEPGQNKRREIDGHRVFALKCLKKQAIVDRGQLSHVKDERKLLLILRHPFILRLFCTFQDPDTLYLLTESISGGELWSVIYEGLSGHPVDGVAVEHARFYSAIVIEALGHMHLKGVAYRDLKPENIMIDSQGYLRLIDLGFAKKIPFVVEVDGEVQVHPKSYTMCGTPEYLAPEFIFNTGHDHSSDYWAFGVLVFELIAGHTPFAPPGAEADMTQLFTMIACVKRDGIQFPSSFDVKAKGTRCRDLVVKLLHPDPSQRLGNLAAKTDDIKQHPYFQEIDWRKLYRKELPGVWIPPDEVPASESNADPGNVAMRYTGDQSVFSEF